jgi:hypothetical protein
LGLGGGFLSVLGALALLVTLGFDFQPHLSVPALVTLCWLPSSALALWEGKMFFGVSLCFSRAGFL